MCFKDAAWIHTNNATFVDTFNHHGLLFVLLGPFNSSLVRGVSLQANWSNHDLSHVALRQLQKDMDRSRTETHMDGCTHVL